MADRAHPELDELRGLLDENLRIEVDEPLHPASQRLMDFLGVEVVVTELVNEVTHCPHPSCTWNYVGDPEKARPYMEAHLRLMHGARQPEQAPLTTSKAKRTSWTREEIVAAIQRWHAEHGETPTQTDWLRRGEWWPAFSTACRVFGSWRAALEAAGLQARRSAPRRPARGDRNALSRERREQRAAEAAAPPFETLAFEQLAAAGSVMDVVGRALVHLEKPDRRVVWAFVRPLIDEALA